MKITYRPEIDGLRAIAVGAVILYHAKIPTLTSQGDLGGGGLLELIYFWLFLVI
jgi:peptidoglycan/LPS O-acetylase OafA/YrhL